MKKIIVSAILLLLTMNTTKAQVYLDPQAPIEERVKDAISRMTTHEKIQVIHAQSKFTSAGVPRLGIRQLNMDDGPHGVREELEWNTWNPAKWTNDFIVAFPSLTCLAATWNRELSATYGNAVSEEFAFRGKDVMLGPGVNIQRTPLNGRAFEYMGEDPYLASEMVVPYIQSAQKNGVACCIKHFVLNDQETDRFAVNVNLSNRALHEIYLEPFRRAVVDAHVYTIMGSYNMWKGVHCCHNDELLNGILKRDWGFDGALVSDWDAATDDWQSATGGLDIEMGTSHNGNKWGEDFTYDDYHTGRPLEQLVGEGKVPMSVLDEKVRRVLRTIFRTAMNPGKAIGSLCSEAHYEACREIGEEGIVLLRNEKLKLPNTKSAPPLLPLTREKLAGLSATGAKPHLLIVGENATRSLTKGGGSSELKTLRDICPLEALQAEYGNVADIDFAQGYASGRAIYGRVDLILFIGGMNKNHRQDCEDGDRESFNLSFGQDDLINSLARIQPRTVVITFGGNPYAMPWLDQVAALLHCWYLGSESGTALARVLSGKVCPSGKLPVTFARCYEDYPYMQYGAEAYPGVNKQVYYKEGIFVGYRHFDTHKVKPLYPFGFGLSYTTFRYGEPTITPQGDGLEIGVDVTNTGQVEGKEVVQLYLGIAPRKSKKSHTASAMSVVERPTKELRDFTKVSLMQIGRASCRERV